MKRVKDWIRDHKVPSVFIAAVLVVALVVGIWAGLAYLTFEDYHLTPVGGELRERNVTDGVVYHHTAASDRPITDHHRYHLTRGWLMAGYHYQIRNDGMIELGRPHNTVGAHAGASANGHTIGVALSGNMQNRPPTDEQYEAAIELHYWLETEAGYGELEIWGHNDFMHTSCPGGHTDLDIIRDGVEQLRAEGREEFVEETPDERIIRQVEIEILEGRVQGKPTSGYLVIEEGRVYVPVRWVSEELGHDVQWHEDERLWEVN